MADEMLFCRSWFLLTESSSSEENDGRVSRFLLSSSSSLLQGEGQLLRPRLSSPSFSPKGGGGGGGDCGDNGRMPPFTEEESVEVHPSTGRASVPGCFFPVFKKSRKEDIKPDFSSEDFSSVCEQEVQSNERWQNTSNKSEIALKFLCRRQI